MGKKLDRVRTHFRENKDRYITGSVCLGVGAAATLIWKRTTTQTLVVETAEVVNQAGRDINNVTINPDPVKRLSYIIRWGEKTFDTQREMAEAIGVSEVNLSRFLNGKGYLKVDLDDVPVRLGVRSES